MKQIVFMAVVFAMVISVVASAIAQDNTNPTDKTIEAFEPQECDTVMSHLLQKKKASLDRRERTIKARETDLKAAEERVKLELEKLTKIRNEIRESMKDLDENQVEEVKRLVKMFEKMRGKKAAAILEATDQDVVVEVLRRIKPKQAGDAMAAMDPTVAAKLAEKLSEFPYQPEKQDDAQ